MTGSRPIPIPANRPPSNPPLSSLGGAPSGAPFPYHVGAPPTPWSTAPRQRRIDSMFNRLRECTTHLLGVLFSGQAGSTLGARSPELP